MQFSKKLAKTAAITLILMMTASIALIALPAQAATYTNMQTGDGVPLPAGVTPDERLKTYAGLSFAPNPIGVGQTLLVNMWLHPPTSNARLLTGYTVTFTKPDGTTEVIGPMDSYRGDSTAWFEYVVDQVGTWTLKFDFPGNYFPAGNYTSGQLIGFSGYGQVYSFEKSCYYEPSTSGDIDLVVQQEQVLSWPPNPLPTDYWTRPISPMNREWKVIAGNWPWPYANNYGYGGPYVIAPNSAHVLMRRLGAILGLVGGQMDQGSLTTGYTGGFPTVTGDVSVIYAGRCYQTVAKPGVGSVAQCWDLRTGEMYYEIPTEEGGITPSVISMYKLSLPPVEGAFAESGPIVRLLSIGSRLIAIDPYTGLIKMNVTGMSGTFYNDPYVLSVQNLGGGRGYRLINWTTEDLVKAGGMASVGTNENFTARIVRNITWPFSSLGTCDFNAGISVTAQSLTDDASGVTMSTRLIGSSLLTGQVLWNITTDHVNYSGSTAVADHGKYCFAVRDSAGGKLAAWDLYSGNVAWVTQDLEIPWGFGGAYAVASAYGLVYRFSYAGVFAIDWDDGHIVWHFTAPAVPFEAPWYPSESFDSGAKVADGKIYVANSEHSATQPLARDWKLWALNATTGAQIWNISGSWGAPGPIADGYLTASNNWDGYLYVFGKGKSATTVTTTPAVIANGAPVLIEGTVLDQSPAQPGTPCISADSMATYMEYLHMQKPVDGLYHNVTVTGVPVQLLAIDANGGVVDIGTATSDVSGSFQMAWTPTAEGVYKITATFAGDDSYGSSWAETGLSVGPAPTVTPPVEIPTPADYTMTIIGMGIAIIIAVAIAALLILRKR